MSPISNFGILAFATAALAIPFAHEHRHTHERRAGAPAIENNVAAPNVTGPAGPVGGAVGGALAGKRGLAYNDAQDTTAFLGGKGIGWAYNWVSNPDGVSSQIQYIPTLHNGDSEFTSVWASDAQKAIDNGAQYLFSFNEPDIPSQANMDPKTAADAWMQHMEPFAGKAKLVAPSVSNSASAGQGLDWLKQFMGYCSSCTIDAVNQHWYDTTSNDISYFQQQVTSAGTQSGLPVFVTEFGFIGSDDQISTSLSQAMDWLDSNNNVLGYAYFMVGDGYLNDGTQPSPYGLTYLNGS